MKVRYVLLVALLVAVVAYAYEAVKELAPFRRVASRGGESCQLIEAPGLVGAEDMEFDHAEGTLWIAAAERHGDASFRPHDSAIYRWKVGAAPAPSRMYPEGFKEPLRFHGMGLQISPAGERRIFVVQHGDAGESVEIFRVSGGTIKHVRSVFDAKFISLNDVAPVGPEAFYVTNDHGELLRFGHVLEDFALLSNASVVYFDGAAARVVASGLRYANGVTVDRGGQHVLVAETLARRMAIFARQPDAGLRLLSRVDLDTSPDNFAQDEHGEYLLAAHPSTMQFLRHAGDPNRRSASQALRFRLGPDGTPGAAETIWLDDGSRFSGSSVAAAHLDYWVVGAVFAKGVLLCHR